MPFRPCPSGCSHFLSADDGHYRCLQCLGFQHAEDAFVDDSCACCGRVSMISQRSHLSFLKGLAPSAATRAGLSGSNRGSSAGALGDLRVTVRGSLPGMPPRTSYSSCSEHPIWFRGDFAGPSHGAPSISFGAPSVDRIFFPGGAWGAGEVVDGPFHGQKPLVCLLRPHYPRRRGCQGVRGHSPGGESDRGAPVPGKRRHLEEPSVSPVQGL